MKWSIPEKIVEQGRKYTNDGRVTAITQDLEENCWHAEVIGTAVYQVKLDGSPREEDQCTCEDWQKKKYCKHTVAVELALRSKGLNRVLKQNPQLRSTYKAPTVGKLFSNSFSKLQTKQTEILLADEMPLTMEYVIESVPTSIHHPHKDIWVLSFKIGLRNERCYVVKNSQKFLECWQAEGVYTIAEGLTVTLTRDSFSDADHSLLESIWDISHMQEVLGAVQYPTKGKLKPRHLFLDRDNLVRTIDMLMKADKLQLKVANINDEKWQIKKDETPFKFKVEPKQKGYVLTVLTEVINYWEYYSWVQIESGMFQLNPRQTEIFETLNQLLKRSDSLAILFEAEEVSDLFTFVLPQLSEIGVVELINDHLSQMVRYPLVNELLFSIADNNLMVQADAVYGDIRFSTNSDLSSGLDEQKTVIRDTVQEQRLLKLLAKQQYQKSKNGYQKQLPKGEALFLFFTKELPNLRKISRVELASELQEQYLDGLKYAPVIEVKEQGSWFDVDFDISGIAEEDISGLMLSLMEQKTYHQLSDGKIISLESESYQKTSHALKELRQYLTFEDNQFLIPKYRSLQLSEILNQTDRVQYDSEFAKLSYDLTHPQELTVPVPKELNADLREYQEVGYRWLTMLRDYGFGGILADDMGLGKTIQTIAFLLNQKECGTEGPALVVAPASLVYNWQNEFKKFAPTLKTIVIMGTQKEREQYLNEADGFDVLIVSYASLRQDSSRYHQMQLSTLILDEAQTIKNPTTKTFQAMKKLKTTQRFALSGTPIENKLEELWSLFAIVMPGFFPKRAKFNRMSASEVAKMIQPFVLRREKREVLKDLPDKIESNVLSVLTDEQKATYLAHLRQMQTKVKGMDSKAFKENHLQILAGLTRLRQICCDPRLFIEDYQGGSGKLDQVKELVAAAKANGRRILLFSQFTGMLNILENELTDMEISTFYLHGGTKPKERIEMVDKFNQGSKDVFLISLKAGGTGLNLTGADTVILYDLWWNPAVEEQAASRAHRMGQKQVVEVWRMISEGTIEEKMYHLQEGKRRLFDEVMSDQDGSKLKKLSEDDIRDILLINE
ncbi:DEAD/DEAH box helicase [Vagococcus coleopterorum]|uniref:DEAD/DEAH box helicase n=1 Tax=Vagococcus coleopterorum TaxID=2714946 RepID=A0A6G8AMB1_9ENTE|nr:DEAD/DEAH box helicase [Vagococcus coleopterorum]QIL46110.1 DEAD/DEAH box helicase [Vagococcus coleopterorum]